MKAQKFAGNALAAKRGLFEATVALSRSNATTTHGGSRSEQLKRRRKEGKAEARSGW